MLVGAAARETRGALLAALMLALPLIFLGLFTESRRGKRDQPGCTVWSCVPLIPDPPCRPIGLIQRPVAASGATRAAGSGADRGGRADPAEEVRDVNDVYRELLTKVVGDATRLAEVIDGLTERLAIAEAQHALVADWTQGRVELVRSALQDEDFAARGATSHRTRTGRSRTGRDSGAAPPPDRRAHLSAGCGQMTTSRARASSPTASGE